MIYCDKRIGDEPRYVLSNSEPSLVIVPDEVRKCVAFIGYRPAGGIPRFAGTCFFAGRPVEGVPDRNFFYAITAKHVLDGIRDAGCNEILLRLNQKDGSAVWASSSLSDRFYHPDESEVVDVAVAYFNLPDGIDHLIYPLASTATEERIDKEGIGVGEEVFFPGLFIHHYGKGRNLPILRAGNIAAMPEEKVDTQLGPIDAYLVEARSIGGLSGSPVFVHLGLARFVDGSVKFSTIPSGIFYLLGLMQGHFAPHSTDIDTTDADDTKSKERINMGMVNSPVVAANEAQNAW